MITPAVSIIVPIYNVEKYLERCIQSLKNQTLSDIEVILVDDESPDLCPELCDMYVQEDNRFKVIHKLNAGLGMARNSGLELATGEYIVFVDSDDYIPENACEVLYKNAKKYDADIVYGDIYKDHNLGENIERVSIVDELTIWEGHDNIKNFLLDLIGNKPTEMKDTLMEVSVWKAAFKRKVFIDNNISFVSERQFISEDLIFDIDFIQCTNKIVVIPEPVYFYCYNPNSLSKVYREDRFEKILILYHEVIRKMEKLYGKKTIQSRTDRLLIARARVTIQQIIMNRKELGPYKTKQYITQLLNCSELREVLDRYPIGDLPFGYKYFSYGMKWKNIPFLYLLISVRNLLQK